MEPLKMRTINVTPLSNRVIIPYGIRIEKPDSIRVIAFRDISELILVCPTASVKEIRGNDFVITKSDTTDFQWESNGITFEELWDKILEAWEDYQECMAFPSLVLGYNTGPGCMIP